MLEIITRIELKFRHILEKNRVFQAILDWKKNASLEFGWKFQFDIRPAKSYLGKRAQKMHKNSQK